MSLLNRNNNSDRGFTIVELIVVIAVIAILATISIVGYGAWRNSIAATQVKNDLNAMASAMESARSFNNVYPTTLPTNVQPSTNVTLTLSLDSTTTTYCVDGVSSDSPTNTFYVASETKDQGPLQGTCVTRPSTLTPPSTAPSGLIATTSSSSQIDLTWGSVAGSGISYTVQRATDSAFVYVVGEISGLSGLSRSSTGLTSNTTYFYRVRADNTGGSGSWSTVASATTLHACSETGQYGTYPSCHNYNLPGGNYAYAPASGQTNFSVTYGFTEIQPTDCPTGFVPVPGSTLFGLPNGFCIMKYEAKQASATVPVSQYAGTPWVSVSQANAITYSANVAGCTGCHLMTESEWMTVAHNALIQNTNWSSGTVGSGFIYSGHNDNSPGNTLAAVSDDLDGYNATGNTTGSSQKRTFVLSNGQVIWDLSGNVSEWINASIAANQQPGFSGEVAYAYKEWNNASLLLHTFPVTSVPSNANSAAASWTSAQGIGQVYSNYGESTVRAYRRGGVYGGTSSTGLFNLVLSQLASDVAASVGFRSSR